MESFDELVEQFTPMIYHVIRSLNIYKNEDEFYQTGVIALWEAHQRFDPDKGKFSTYAYSYMKGKMMTELTKHTRVEERNVYPEETFWDATVDDEWGDSVAVSNLAFLLRWSYRKAKTVGHLHLLLRHDSARNCRSKASIAIGRQEMACWCDGKNKGEY